MIFLLSFSISKYFSRQKKVTKQISQRNKRIYEVRFQIGSDSDFITMGTFKISNTKKKEYLNMRLTYEVEFLRYHLANDDLKMIHAHNHDQAQKWPKTWSLANTNTLEHKSI